jgi:hypothetical protein
MRHSLSRLTSFILLLALAACQPLPQPFAEDRPKVGSALLTPRDGAGIEVQPVTGAPAPLAEALAVALRDADVPAYTESANRASLKLVGTAREVAQSAGTARIELRWELFEADGSSAGTHAEAIDADLAAWRGGNGDVLARLAKAAAPRIAALLQEDGAVDRGNGEPSVLVRPVAGAPGDGSRSLARAMVASLQQAKVAVTDKEPGAGLGAKLFVVSGNVSLTAAGEGKQKVTVSWILFDPKGLQVGQVSQSNAVPAGSLDGRWGEIAYAVANAAAGGIVALLERLKAPVGS